jgi:hypothetical protein
MRPEVKNDIHIHDRAALRLSGPARGAREAPVQPASKA